jgi:hypothetical protein
MIKCLCINDSDRPNEIPISKWVKMNEFYHVIYTVTVLPQRELAFHLSEINLTENELPYEYFLAKRFAFNKKDLPDLLELIKNCSDIDMSIDNLLEMTETYN